VSVDATDPFALLGLSPVDATAPEVRAARRRLAKAAHPDRGGDPARMQALNLAAEAALAAVRERDGAPAPPSAERRPPEPSPAAGPAGERRPQGPRRPGRVVERDDASFTVSVLPVEAFEALSLVAAWLGQVLVDEAPYVLECYLDEPTECFCRLELFPEAGGSIVAVTVVSAEGGSWPPPSADDVRDAFIGGLEELGGSS